MYDVVEEGLAAIGRLPEERRTSLRAKAVLAEKAFGGMGHPQAPFLGKVIEVLRSGLLTDAMLNDPGAAPVEPRNEWCSHVTRIIHCSRSTGINRAFTKGMELFAFSAAQQTPQPLDAATEVNSAGWGIMLWVMVLAVVFFVLLAAAGLSLIGAGRRMDGPERGRVPDADGVVLARAGDVTAVRRKSDAVDPVLVSPDPGHFLPGRRVVEVQGLPAAAGQVEQPPRPGRSRPAHQVGDQRVRVREPEPVVVLRRAPVQSGRVRRFFAHDRQHSTDVSGRS